MKLGTKLSAMLLGTVALATIAALAVERHIIEKQGVQLTRDTMRAAVVEAENVRSTISHLNEKGAFDRKKLLEEYKQSGDLRGSTLYNTIPVVAAWRAIEQVAKEENFDFRVAKVRARNPKNNPTPEELLILDELKRTNADEYFTVDSALDQMVYARPIRLTSDCLTCHGDPKTSPTGDGRDILGFEMENWKAGEMHGVFILRSDMGRVHKVVYAGMAETLAIVVPISALLGLGFVLFLRKRIISPMMKSIKAIDGSASWTADASAEISNASQLIANGASEQAASVEETHASVEEIGGHTQRNANSAADARQLATDARKTAESGAAQMDKLVEAMNSIRDAGAGITKIVKSIDDIAFQTNILALNAAVEAARAGEAGAGFAIVAEQVRLLAQRSALAARETAQLVADSVSRSEHGASVTTTVSASFSELNQKALKIEETLRSISSASNEQNHAIAQLTEAVGQLDTVTQTNAAGAEETSSAAEQLRQQAELLRGTVVQLMAVVEGKATTETPEHANHEAHLAMSEEPAGYQMRKSTTAQATKPKALIRHR